jgi:hypothetical protein
MNRANMRRRALRRVLLALVLLGLELVAFMITAAPVEAAPRQPAQSRSVVHRSQSSAAAKSAGNPNCNDPQQITLACLNIIPDGRPLPDSTIQNPIASGSTLFFLTSPADTIGQATVLKLWGIMLIVVDVCGALMLILNGLYIIIGGTVFRYARAVETIPGMLVALIAAHISLIFIGVFLGFNNAVVYDLYQWAGNNINISMQSGIMETEQVIPANVSPGDCPSNYLSGPACAQTVHVDVLSKIQITPQSLDFTSMLQNITSLFDMLSVVVKIMSLMLLAQVLIRLFFIDLYIVLAPIGIACWALPGKVGQPVTRMWFQGFLSTVLVQFVQVVALILVEALLLPLFNYFYPHIINISHPVMQVDTLVMILNIALLWFVFRIPSLFEAAPMRSLIEAGQSMSAAVGMSISVQIGMMQTVFSGVGGAVGLLGGLLG